MKRLENDIVGDRGKQMEGRCDWTCGRTRAGPALRRQRQVAESWRRRRRWDAREFDLDWMRIGWVIREIEGRCGSGKNYICMYKNCRDAGGCRQQGRSGRELDVERKNGIVQRLTRVLSMSSRGASVYHERCRPHCMSSTSHMKYLKYE